MTEKYSKIKFGDTTTTVSERQAARLKQATPPIKPDFEGPKRSELEKKHDAPEHGPSRFIPLAHRVDNMTPEQFENYILNNLL